MRPRYGGPNCRRRSSPNTRARPLMNSSRGWANGSPAITSDEGGRSMHISSVSLEGVATVEIARPEKRNALTQAMYRALAEAITGARADDAVRAVLITGQPGIFTAGNDLEDFMHRPPLGEDSAVGAFMQALLDCEKPVVAAVTGAAVGIGATMLLHCDLVYISEQAQL